MRASCFFPVHQHIPRCIAAAVINNDDLEVLPALAQDAVQASIQVPCPVPDGDNDADEGAVFHGVHLLWGKRFGKARRTGALIAFWVEGCILGYRAFCRRGFASAEATRGLCDRPLDCFASPSKFVDGICYRETRRGRKENRTLCAK